MMDAEEKKKEDWMKYLGLLIAIALLSLWVGSLRARIDALEYNVKDLVDAVKYLSDNMAVRAK